MSCLDTSVIHSRAISTAISHSLVLAVAKGMVVLSKSVTPARITANLSGAVRAFETLTKADIERLDALAGAGKQKRFVYSRSTILHFAQLFPPCLFTVFKGLLLLLGVRISHYYSVSHAKG